VCVCVRNTAVLYFLFIYNIIFFSPATNILTEKK